MEEGAEQSKVGKAPDVSLIYLSTLTFGHEFCVNSKRSQKGWLRHPEGAQNRATAPSCRTEPVQVVRHQIRILLDVLPLEVFQACPTTKPRTRWKMIYLLWLGNDLGSSKPDATSGKILCSNGQALSNKYLAGEWMSHVSIIVHQRLKTSNQQSMCCSKERNKNMSQSSSLLFFQ